MQTIWDAAASYLNFLIYLWKPSSQIRQTESFCGSKYLQVSFTFNVAPVKRKWWFISVFREYPILPWFMVGFTLLAPKNSDLSCSLWPFDTASMKTYFKQFLVASLQKKHPPNILLYGWLTQQAKCSKEEKQCSISSKWLGVPAHWRHTTRRNSSIHTNGFCLWKSHLKAELMCCFAFHYGSHIKIFLSKSASFSKHNKFSSSLLAYNNGMMSLQCSAWKQ